MKSTRFIRNYLQYHIVLRLLLLLAMFMEFTSLVMSLYNQISWLMHKNTFVQKLIALKKNQSFSFSMAAVV